MKTHKPVITTARYISASEDDEGFCTICEDFTDDCCEPDAREYECPICGHNSVFGAEEALLMGHFILK